MDIRSGSHSQKHNIFSEFDHDTTQDFESVGDMIRRIAGNRWDRFLIGAPADVLTVVAGLPEWAAPAAPSLHNILSASHDATVAAAVAGDILRRNVGNTAWERLAIGAGTNVLTVVAGLPAWAAPAAPSLHNILSASHDATVAAAVAGDILRRNVGNTAWERLAIGAATNVLTVVAGLPAWAAAGGGGSNITRIAGSSGASGPDITWQRLTANSVDVTTVALSASLMSTTGLGAGTYTFRYILIYQTAALTTGIAFGVNHTGTVTKFVGRWQHITTGGAAATGVGDDVAATVGGQLNEGKSGRTLNAIIGSASAGVATINKDILAVLEGILVVSVSGDLQLKIATEIAGSAVRLIANSILELHKIG